MLKLLGWDMDASAFWLSLLNYLYSIHLSSVVLLLMLFVNFWILYRSRLPGSSFILAQMLEGPDAAKSATRWGVLISIAFSSWLLVYMATDAKVSDNTKLWVFGIYIAIWSGAKVVEKAIDAWTAVRGHGVPPPPPSTTTSTVQTTEQVVVKTE